MNLNKQRLSETSAKYLIFAILLSICLIPSNLKSQDISTVGEIYDFQIGDIFHFDFYGNGQGYGMSSVTNIEIIDLYFSQNNDTIFYVRDIDYRESSSENPGTIFKYYIDTIFYANLDSLVHSGFIDTVYSDEDLYNGRTINSVTYGTEDTWRLMFVNGCGQVKTRYTSWGQTTESEDKLVYYKKGNEEWGNPSPVSIEELSKIPHKFELYPNPAKEYVNIKLSNSDYGLVTITSLTGEILKTKELNANLTSIDISSLNPGIYLIAINLDGNLLSEKILKK